MFEVEAGNVKTAVDTLQQAAQQEVDDLSGQIKSLGSSLVTANQELAADAQEITQLKAQLSAQQPVVYDRLESNVWKQTFSAASKVGGDGNGTAGQKKPGIECAELSITPVVGHYFDCYNFQDFPPHDACTRYSYRWPFLFPSSADAAASQAVEMELRPIQLGGLEFMGAAQLDFADKQLRAWIRGQGWAVNVAPLTRLLPGQWYTVQLDYHRDDKTVYYDSLAINDQKYALTASYPAFNDGWGTRTRVSCQLDGNGRGDAYRVKIDDVKFTMS